MAGTETELQELTTKLENVIKKLFLMEINIDKSKIFVNSHNDHAPTNITINSQKLEEVTYFRYLGQL
jgi:hypothetical protein